MELRLTRYNGGSRGPVLLSHCIGVSSSMYSLDTIETNLVEHLVEHGFDVWLLDHRLSIELPASKLPSTLDDVAAKDYPAAVAAVLELSGSPSLQVVCHGVGSSTFTMAMLAGLQGVRAAVCSQVSTDLLVTPGNRVKAKLRMPEALQLFGADAVTAYTDRKAAWGSRLYNSLLSHSPMEAEEDCRSPVCKRITAIYGHLYEHDQLSAATHANLHEFFGRVNLTALRQLSLLSRAGHLVNASGEEAYLPHLKRMAIPVALLHGGENICVLPRSTELTLERLAAENGAALYKRHVIPNYGHVDCMLGENAAQDVFPLVTEHLAST